MNRSIIVLGSSAVGKTTLLQELSGAQKYKYGVTKAIVNPLMIGKYVHLPEITGNVARIAGQAMLDFIKDNLVITDVSLKFPIGNKYVTNAEILVLDADNETIERNLRSRKGKTKGKFTFEHKLKTCIEYRDKCRAKGYPIYNYDEMKAYLINLTK